MKKISLQTIVAVAVFSNAAHGANLLTVNADYDSGITSTFQNAAGTYTNTAGWVLTVTGGFGGVANDQLDIGTPVFAYSRGDSVWTTAIAARAVVTGGLAYAFNFSGRRDGGNTEGGIVFVDWFDDMGGSLGSSADFGGDFQTTGTTGGDVAPDPYGNFSHTVIAPVGAEAAGVRWGGNVSPVGQVIADNFFIDVVPEPSSALLAGLGTLTLLGFRRRD